MLEIVCWNGIFLCLCVIEDNVKLIVYESYVEVVFVFKVLFDCFRFNLLFYFLVKFFLLLNFIELVVK